MKNKTFKNLTESLHEKENTIYGNENHAHKGRRGLSSSPAVML
jgi:hypothetical protein